MGTGFYARTRTAGLFISAALACQSMQPSANARGFGNDLLYVGDAADSAIKSFNAQGGFLRQSSGDNLNGPNGLLIAGPEIIVVNQNFETENGEILQYQLKDLSFTDPWVSKINADTATNPDAPFAPRGAVINNGVLYVADFVKDGVKGTPGAVRVFAGDGSLLGKLTPPADPFLNLANKFRPRAAWSSGPMACSMSQANRTSHTGQEAGWGSPRLADRC